MGNVRSKAEKSHIKDIKQGIIDQRPVHGKKKGPKPYKITATIWVWKNFTLGKYHTLHDAEKALAVYKTKNMYADLKLIGPGLE